MIADDDIRALVQDALKRVQQQTFKDVSEELARHHPDPPDEIPYGIDYWIFQSKACCEMVVPDLVVDAQKKLK